MIRKTTGCALVIFLARDGRDSGLTASEPGSTAWRNSTHGGMRTGLGIEKGISASPIGDPLLNFSIMGTGWALQLR
jgi:hypothetical protein